MDSGHRLIFDSSPHHGHMLVLGGSGNSIIRGARSGLGLEEGSNKRRPFFTSHDEDYYYDHELQLPDKKRRLTPEQVHLLERSFEEENKLEPERKGELAKRLGLQPRQVAVWFQNRRARWKTKTLERDFDRLKAAYDSLLADRDLLIKGNHRLRSQLATLTDEPDATVGPAGAAAAGGGDRAAKADDRVSTGSGVVDGGSSSGSAFFRGGLRGHGHCIVGPAEEDDGSDNGGNFMPADAGGMFEDQSHDHAADNWWGVWN